MENSQLRGWPRQCSSVTWIKLQKKHLQPVVYENKTKSLPQTYVDAWNQAPHWILSFIFYSVFHANYNRNALRVPSMHFLTMPNWYNSCWWWANCLVTKSFLNWAFQITKRVIYNKYVLLKLFRCYDSIDLWSPAFIT